METKDLIKALDYVSKLDDTSKLIGVVDLALLAIGPCTLGLTKTLVAGVIVDSAFVGFEYYKNGAVPTVMKDAYNYGKYLVGMSLEDDGLNKASIEHSTSSEL